MKGRRNAFTFALACAVAVILTKAVGGVLFLIPGKASCDVGAVGRKDEVTAASNTFCVRETAHEKGERGRRLGWEHEACDMQFLLRMRLPSLHLYPESPSSRTLSRYLTLSPFVSEIKRQRGTIAFLETRRFSLVGRKERKGRGNISAIRNGASILPFELEDSNLLEKLAVTFTDSLCRDRKWVFFF